MNIYDVSEKAGVSIATVSRVMNGNSNVSEKTRNKVLAVMEELGYTPNAFARSLGLGTMKIIGIMCSDSSDIYLANAIYYLERELRLSGYDSILCCTGYNLDTKKKALNLLLSKQVDGIILAGSKFVELKEKDNSYILKAASKVPIMLVNGCLEGHNIYSTLCDDYTAVHQTVTSLINQGRRRILYLYSSRSYSGSNKMAGYLAACRDAGLDMDSCVYQCKKDILASHQLIEGLYQEGKRFDAVVTSDDSLAVGAVKFALKHSISIPEQLSIVGYNNSVLSICCTPELSSIDSKIEALCTTAVATLMGAFEGKNVPGRTTISADFIKRSTTNF